MRVLWTGNYSSQSGYSLQGRLFVPRIQQLGHEVVVFELSNGQRLPQIIDGVKIVPTALDPLGSDIMLAHAQQSGAHAVISLIDAWGMNRDVMSRLQWFPLTPVDTRPVAPHVVESLKGAKRPIAISQYGVSELRKVGFDPFYWPHAVDPAVWYLRDKDEARRALKLRDDLFLVSFVGVNDSTPSRKGIPEMLMAWQIFSASHPDALLYLHTAEHGNLAINSMGGVKIDVLMQTFGIDPKTVQIVDQYRYRTGIPASELANVAGASDVLLLPTRGEGFGLPLLEFQRAGCPVITTDTCTGPELCFSGWLISSEPEWSWQDAVVSKPGVVSIVEALEAAYDDRDNPARRARAVEGAREYDIDRVMSQYVAPVLRLIAEDVLDNIRVS